MKVDITLDDAGNAKCYLWWLEAWAAVYPLKLRDEALCNSGKVALIKILQYGFGTEGKNLSATQKESLSMLKNRRRGYIVDRAS